MRSGLKAREIPPKYRQKAVEAHDGCELIVRSLTRTIHPSKQFDSHNPFVNSRFMIMNEPSARDGSLSVSTTLDQYGAVLIQTSVKSPNRSAVS